MTPDTRLVPVEPTEEMIEAYFEMCRRHGSMAHINATAAWTAMLSAAPALPALEAVAWEESFIADEEEGPVVGILIDLPDGAQIWTGECSNALLQEAAARDESPDESGLFLMIAAKGKPTRVVAQIATTDDGIALARAVALAHGPNPAPDASALREALKESNELLVRWLAQSCDDDGVEELQTLTRGRLAATRAALSQGEASS